MKIAIYSDNFYPELSGISDSIILLSQELAKRGHEINFYVPKYTDEDYLQAKVSEKEPNLGKNIRITRMFSFPYPAATGQSRIVIPTGLRALDARKFNPDIIHTQLFFGVGLEALAASKFLRVPLVGTNHTPITEFVKYAPLQGKWGKENMLRYIAWYYNACSYVTTPSSPLLKEMKKQGLIAPSSVLSNPIDVSSFYPASTVKEKTRLKKKYKFTPHTLLYSGRLADEKHVDILIRAVSKMVKQIPDVRLAITGNGIDEKSLRQLSEKLNLTKHILFLGMVPTKTLREIYQASDIFVIASTAETQSLALMKAMATGLPVIGVNAWGLPDYIKDNENGFLIEPHNPTLFAKKALHLFSHEDKYKKMSDYSLHFVQQFSSSFIAASWEKIYEGVLNHKEAR